MGTKSSDSQVVASRYASAFLDMAADANVVEKVEKDMQELAAMVAGSEDLQSLVRNPLMNREQQKRGILALADKAGFQKLTVSFLGTLAENRRLPVIMDVIKAFNAELKKRRGLIEAKVETAYALDAKQTKALQDALAKAMGQNVTLDVAVNKDLLGGMVVTVGSRMIDNSVRRKLERLQRAMSNGANHNVALKEVS